MNELRGVKWSGRKGEKELGEEPGFEVDAREFKV